MVAAIVSSVRPWKPPRRQTMVLPPLPARLAYRRASFIEPSFASAPEFAKNVSHTCSPSTGAVDAANASASPASSADTIAAAPAMSPLASLESSAATWPRCSM